MPEPEFTCELIPHASLFHLVVVTILPTPAGTRWDFMLAGCLQVAGVYNPQE